MKTVFHPESSRGQMDYGWLKARYSFSFARWFNPERVQFGALRVLNDDRVAKGQGFGTHPHDNMEIITIPLEGAVAHKDSMGSAETVSAGEVQVMSAGTGIQHSEFNPSETEDLRLFQIWIFPRERGVEPRYEQKRFAADDRAGKLQLLVSPDGEGESLWINQDAWLSRIDLKAGEEFEYKLRRSGDGVYVMNIDGAAQIDSESLSTRDAMGVWDTDGFEITAEQDTQLLFIEVPMLD